MKKPIIIAYIMLLQACASSQYQSILSEDLKRIQSTSSVTVKYFETRPFNLMTPTGVVRAEYGEGLAEKAIASLTDSGEMPAESPSQLLTDGIIQKTTEKLRGTGINITSIDDKPMPLPKPEDFSYSADSDYIFEFSFSWGAAYLPLNWKTYAISIRGEGRLIRMPDQAVVWKGVCNLGGYDDDRLVATSDDFKQRKSKKLESAMLIAAEECSDQFTKQINRHDV